MTYSVDKALKQAREGVKAPLAYGMTFGECGDPECPAIHVALFQRNGRPIARAAFTVEMIEALAQRAGFKLVRDKQN
jgi:hypothetical protein